MGGKMAAFTNMRYAKTARITIRIIIMHELILIEF